ncbi:MAG: ferrous iron transport protein B [Gemmatimonadetes bacterium]|nr:ferrous iron transport protein B [Gemmatimonadota bacterium]NNM07131.1 ferrous iron transport protein B [Gemmatimonadota bacterium]
MPASGAVSSRSRIQRDEGLIPLGLQPDRWDLLVALAGNPNTGKSTVFNALTGLRQHTGNWPGKTVARAEGVFAYEGNRVKLVDLPGIYSLQAGSTDEEVARDFILFGRPDVTVVVVDATRLERNLNLVLQILEITPRVVVCLNLMDEAKRHGIAVDPVALEDRLGVPVVPTVAREKRGIQNLLRAVHEVATGERATSPYRLERLPKDVESAIAQLKPAIEGAIPGVPNARWLALRLLNADESVEQALKKGEFGPGADSGPILQLATSLRWSLSPEFHDRLTESLFGAAEEIAGASMAGGVRRARFEFDRKLDGLLTSRLYGFPLMLAVLAVLFWITVEGANVPSAFLASVLIDKLHPILLGFGESLGLPWWLNGLLFDGMYRATAWVISVMLPPMAIFFPLFTLLEDFGYLPRVAFNLDSLFRRTGAHGKQALTMCMGFGCNAAGVVATRVIDSPRERLIAIITNNFSLCNGRWPTQILIASIFLGTLAPAHLAGLLSAASVVSVAVLGIGFMFLTSWFLSRTVLKGEATTFSLELPPYRPPRVLQTLYTSLIDRTLIVLWRAVVFALPAGAVIWLVANIPVGGGTLAETLVGALDPFGLFLGLNGVILLAYVVAIPANEIVIPTVLMLTVLLLPASGQGEGAGVMFELGSAGTGEILRLAGWTTLTGVNLMLFSLLHNPCSTTLYTIYQETKSWGWTALAAGLPLALGFIVTFLVAQVWRLVA